MEYNEQYYYPYKELCETGRQDIYTKDFNASNIARHFYSIINILRDGIETKEVQSMMVHIYFTNNVDVRLSIFDYTINLMFWQFCTATGEPIRDVHLVFFEDITKRSIKEYIDNIYIDKYRKTVPFIVLNNTIDDVIGKFRELRPFQMYLANTLNLEDTLELMRKYPEFNDTIHFSTEGIPIEDIKEAGIEATNKQIKYIKNSNHHLRDSFRTGEAISPKQYKEVAVNIGSKPDGQGSVFPHPIKHSFMNGGLQTPEELVIESSVGRVAQILQKTNVGESGAFARQLELNNQDTTLHVDPNYVCDTVHFEEVIIDNDSMWNMYDMRYYRENPNGVDKLLNAKNKKDKERLMHRKLYFRSPMTCASAARGHGICYKCYGDLAYVNREINIGQIAAEGLSSIYTQILLSAKHLLESLVVKMEWSKGFYDYLQITFNTIALREDKFYKGCKLIIDQDICTLEELDDIDYNYYINSFIIKTPSGDEIKIKTNNDDNLYFDKDFYDFLINNYPDTSGAEETYYAEIDMMRLVDFPALFVVEIKNNELSATMDKIERLIDNKTVMSAYDRNTILREFISTNIQGNIKLNAVHFEVLLMNQMRDGEDDLEKPDWTNPNATYQMLTLSKALSNNQSIAIRLQSGKVDKILNNQQNRFICKPSVSDIYYMEQPQEYLSDEFISDDNRPKSDIEKSIRQPITFDNPKIRVGRKPEKKKV